MQWLKENLSLEFPIMHEIQVKTILRFYRTPIRKASIRKGEEEERERICRHVCGGK